MFSGQRRYGKNPDQVIRAAPATFRAPLKWHDERKVFTCSWSDWFIPEADDWRADAWAIMRETPQHTYQVLTKRPERITQCLPADWSAGYANVWLGVSAEDQKEANLRLPLLCEVPAVVRFVSCEPMLGPIQLDLTGLGWVICGGESGSQRRHFERAWARDLYTQCQAAGVAFFYKQGSGLHPGSDDLLDGRQVHEFPVGGGCVELGSAAA
jgi:protein gp37